MQGKANTFAAQAGAFDAAKRHCINAIVCAVVDHHAAALQFGGGAEGSLDIFGKNASLQAVIHIIGPLDGLIQRAETMQNNYRAINFFPRQRASFGQISQHGGGVKCAIAPAAGEKGCALLKGLIDHSLNPDGFSFVDERPHVSRFVQLVPYLIGFSQRGKPFGKIVVDFIVKQ